MGRIAIGLMLALGLGLGLAACDRAGAIELRDWTTGGSTLHMPGRLPATEQPGRWSVSTELAVPEAWRGQRLTLAVPAYHSHLELDVDGAPAERLDASPGSVNLTSSHFAFRIPASPAATRRLTLSGPRATYLDAMFPTAPRVSATLLGDPAFRASASFGLWTTRLAIGMILLLTFIYASAWWLDRRPAHGWFGLQAAAASFILATGFGGLPVLGSATVHFLPASFCGGVVVAAAFLHAHFGVGRMPRVMPLSFALAAIVGVVSWLDPLQLRWEVVGWVIGFADFGYVALVLARLMRDPRHFGDAVLFAVAWATTLAVGSFDVWALMVPWWVGFVGTPLGLSGYALLQTYVVTRERVRRTREVETLNAELRRQIADRSRELADALVHTPLPTPLSLVPGAIVEGRYRVIRRLGAGGMGAVHEIERIADGRRLALKVLTGHAAGEALARFAREAQVAAELDHPHLISVADVGMSRTLGLYLVMELVDGGSLEAQRARFGDPAWSLPLLAQIAEGMAAMHAAGVVHRDLKPANVLISKSTPPSAKIADFGIAGLRGAANVDAMAETSAGQLTMAGAFMGTPAYMAPELARGADQAGPPVDVFAFGVLAHEMIAGKPPFPEPPVVALQRGGTFVTPARLPRVSPALADTLAACLAFEPGARPTAQTLRDRLVTPPWLISSEPRRSTPLSTR